MRAPRASLQALPAPSSAHLDVRSKEIVHLRRPAETAVEFLNFKGRTFRNILYNVLTQFGARSARWMKLWRADRSLQETSHHDEEEADRDPGVGLKQSLSNRFSNQPEQAEANRQAKLLSKAKESP